MKLPKSLFAIFAFLNVAALNSQNESPTFSHAIEEGSKPWTNKPFYNNPDNFQFAIVSDRTGGHREGVFGKAIEKINQLYPEFVMSVGDLIEGYTKDNDLLNEQWKEFDSILNPLSSRFFLVAGNHDYSNEIMAKQWKERYGKDYYHFLYKNVLFLVANSNDGEGIVMGKDQVAFMKEAIEQHPDVRWTMIFMHHPMWTYGEMNGFNEVEEVLKNRKYTVFAGHTHRYLFEVRNDQNHYVLATTGGGSKLLGPKFGEFDHIGWVTMTDNGPKLVNLELSGIIEHNISNKISRELAAALIESTEFNTLVMQKGTKRKVVLLLKNTTEKTIHFKGRLYHHHQVKPDTSRFEVSISPASSHELIINTTALADLDSRIWDPLELEWEMGYDSRFMEPELKLSGSEIIELSVTEPALAMTEQNIFIKELKIDLRHPYRNLAVKYALDGSEVGGNSPIFSNALNIDKTTKIKMKLTDSEGFESGIVEKIYSKVEPANALKSRKKLKKGLQYAYYEGYFDSVPDFSTLKPVKNGSVVELNPDKIGQRLDHFAIQYTGYIEIPKTGIYTFYLTSDDGSKLYLNNELLIDNDGSHDVTLKTGMKALKKGMHPVRIDYFEDFLGERLELEYSGPAIEKSKVRLWH